MPRPGLFALSAEGPGVHHPPGPSRFLHRLEAPQDLLSALQGLPVRNPHGLEGGVYSHLPDGSVVPLGKVGTIMYTVVGKPQWRKEGVMQALTVEVRHPDGGTSTRAWDDPESVWLVVRRSGEAQPERT
jgi:hypothetical protein